MKILRERKPKYILEIGNWEGFTLKRFGEVASEDAVIIGVDILKVDRFKTSENQELHLIQGDSQLHETLNTVQHILKGNMLDFLFIDGDHMEVEKDYNLYAPLVKPGGLIGLHDIVPGLPEGVGVVPEYWRKIKGDNKYLELVNDWNQGGYGIGVIYK
ncbi:CmcI family methyltransferase [Peribacillus sp. NPDC094092]|uniref:CmcI family methyltransferase n=1 Tax=Peribacillus sp. NPDC094092 TaxID=3390611 RepID=UPI003D08B57B